MTCLKCQAKYLPTASSSLGHYLPFPHLMPINTNFLLEMSSEIPGKKIPHTENGRCVRFCAVSALKEG